HSVAEDVVTRSLHSRCMQLYVTFIFFFFQAEDGIRDRNVTGVQTCALPISRRSWRTERVSRRRRWRRQGTWRSTHRLLAVADARRAARSRSHPRAEPPRRA